MSKAVVTNNQPSITEWFAVLGDKKKSDELREEDNHKHQRLELLYQKIGLEYERPERWSAEDLKNKTPEAVELLNSRGDELCAFRLVPKDDKLPKLRNRGLNIADTYKWFSDLNINYKDYDVFVCPHTGEILWSAIFIVNDEAIFGEIIRGLHSQLTHGETENELIQFRYDYDLWQWSADDSEAKDLVTKMVEKLLVKDKKIQKELSQELNAKFSHNYLAGYFEATVWPGNKIYFIDYSRILADYIKTPPAFELSGNVANDILKGITANAGTAKGKVRIVNEKNIETVDFPKGSILVCDITDVRFVPLMQKAGAIITDRGGILSHAAIVAREMGKPCIIGTKNSTKVLKDGDLVEVDANAGVVRIIKKIKT
ncbi:MAG: PEP-utilizing enzyme [Patescibacteria group bacterium]|nr:PEP-utilizing enzyme [Patescibacteria group bacterium]